MHDKGIPENKTGIQRKEVSHHCAKAQTQTLVGIQFDGTLRSAQTYASRGSWKFVISCIAAPKHSCSHRVHIFTRDEAGVVCLPTQLERTLQLYW
jgi:hypothetical protein